MSNVDEQYKRESQHDQVEQTFAYHRPEYQETMDEMGALRGHFKAMGHHIVDACPDSRERSLALSRLDEACMYSIAALARHEPVPVSQEPNTTSHPPRMVRDNPQA